MEGGCPRSLPLPQAGLPSCAAVSLSASPLAGDPQRPARTSPAPLPSPHGGATCTELVAELPGAGAEGRSCCGNQSATAGAVREPLLGCCRGDGSPSLRPLRSLRELDLQPSSRPLTTWRRVLVRPRISS